MRVSGQSARKVGTAVGTPPWTVQGVLGVAGERDLGDAAAVVERFLAAPVDSVPGVGLPAMALVRTHVLTDEPTLVADNGDSVARRTFVVANMTALGSGEWLGVDAGVTQQLGEGVPIGPNAEVAFELAGGEELYAAAPDADGVELRVLEFRSS